MRSLEISVILFILVRHTIPICYYPNGDVAPQDTPCRSDTEQSTCCGEGYACLSNNMCKATGNELQQDGATEFVRGSCTDKIWRSGDCPNFCADPNYDDTAGGNGIGKCKGSDTLFYCIDSQDVDCDNEVNVLTFHQAPSALTTIGVAPTTTSSATSSRMTATSSSQTSSTRIVKPSQTSMASNTASSGGESSNSNNNATGIGVGVGVGVGGLGVAALVAVWFLLRRKNAQKRALADTREAVQPLNLTDLPGYHDGMDRGDREGRYIYEAPTEQHKTHSRAELYG